VAAVCRWGFAVSRLKILVIGSANIDLVMRVARCPRPGETLMARSLDTITGGKGANQAVAAARLGGEVFFAGCVGGDGFGALQRAALGAEGIDLSALKTHEREATGTAMILVGDDGQNAIVVAPAANFGLTPGDVAALEPVMRAVDVVLLQLEVPLETVEAALDLARRCGVFSVLDAGPAQCISPTLFAKADLLSPNETETEAITGSAVATVEDARRAAGWLRERGARQVVIKLGARGCLAVGAEEHYVPAFEISPVDTTAAGDAFTAALAVGWGAGIGPALRFANAAGALAALGHGAQPSMPTRGAVEAFLEQQSDIATRKPGL